MKKPKAAKTKYLAITASLMIAIVLLGAFLFTRRIFADIVAIDNTTNQVIGSTSSGQTDSIDWEKLVASLKSDKQNQAETIVGNSKLTSIEKLSQIAGLGAILDNGELGTAIKLSSIIGNDSLSTANKTSQLVQLLSGDSDTAKAAQIVGLLSSPVGDTDKAKTLASLWGGDSSQYSDLVKSDGQFSQLISAGDFTNAGKLAKAIGGNAGNALSVALNKNQPIADFTENLNSGSLDNVLKLTGKSSAESSLIKEATAAVGGSGATGENGIKLADSLEKNGVKINDGPLGKIFGSGNGGGPPAAVITLCDNLFKGDKTNIFKEVLCSVIRTTSMAVSDLAVNTTCTIQTVGNAGNYKVDTRFTPDTSTGECSISPPFGIKDPVMGNHTGVYQVSQLTTDLSKPNGNYRGSFNITRGIMGVLALIGLFVFAFAQIMHYDLNNYAIKRALPAIGIALVGGALSLSIVILLSRFVDILYRLTIFDPSQTTFYSSVMNNIFHGDSGFAATGASGLPASIKMVFDVGGKLLGSTASSGNPTFLAGIFGTIFLTIPAVIVIVFEYVLALRPFVIGILTVIAPFAFASLILPQTQFLFRKWWTYLLLALFYAPLVNFVFYFLNKIEQGTGAMAFIAVWMVKVAALIFLIRLPFTFELDSRKITTALSKTSLGEALGLGKILGKNISAREVKAKLDKDELRPVTSAASKLIAGANPAKLLDRRIAGEQKTQSIKTGRLLASTLSPNVSGLLAQAHQTNLGRSSELIAKSVKDLSGDAFRAVINRSDLQLWKDTRLIEQLKNQNGQVLDSQGAALRADAARKSLRLAQAIDSEKLLNPDMMKLMAQKGALSNLPVAAVSEAIREGVLSKEDLRATYRGDTDKMFERFQSLESTGLKNLMSNTPQKLKSLMNQDQKDYATGYHDLSLMMSSAVSGQTSATAQSMVQGMKNSDSNVFGRSGEYMLGRLGQEKTSAQGAISSAMRQGGATAQTASAIASNPRIGFDQAAGYVSSQASASVINQMKRGFAARDLSSSLIGEVSKDVIEKQSLVGRSIAGKIGENFRSNASLNLDQIKSSMQQVAAQMAGSVSPAQMSQGAAQVSKYHPAAILENGTDANANKDKIRQNAEEVLQTAQSLISAGFNREQIANSPDKVQDSIESLITEKIQNQVSGKTPAGKPTQTSDTLNTNKARKELSSDKVFETELGNVAKLKKPMTPNIPKEKPV